MFQRRMGQRAAFWGGELFVHRCAIARHSLLFQMFMLLLIQTERYFDWSFSHDRFSFQFIRGYRGIASPNKRIWTAKCYACEFSFCIAVSFL